MCFRPRARDVCCLPLQFGSWSPELRAFVEQQFLSFPILVASGTPSRDQLIGPVEAMPTSYLVTPEGEVVARQVGQITAEAIKGFIERYEQQKNGGEKQ